MTQTGRVVALTLPAMNGPVVLAGDLNAPILSSSTSTRLHAYNVNSVETSLAVSATPTLLMLALGPTWMRSLVEGMSQEEVETALPDWELLAVEPADTRGLGWPMNRTRPQWYRLRRRKSKDSV